MGKRRVYGRVQSTPAMKRIPRLHAARGVIVETREVGMHGVSAPRVGALHPRAHARGASRYPFPPHQICPALDPRPRLSAETSATSSVAQTLAGSASSANLAVHEPPDRAYTQKRGAGVAQGIGCFIMYEGERRAYMGRGRSYEDRHSASLRRMSREVGARRRRLRAEVGACELLRRSWGIIDALHTLRLPPALLPNLWDEGELQVSGGLNQALRRGENEGSVSACAPWDERSKLGVLLLRESRKPCEVGLPSGPNFRGTNHFADSKDQAAVMPIQPLKRADFLACGFLLVDPELLILKNYAGKIQICTLLVSACCLALVSWAGDIYLLGKFGRCLLRLSCKNPLGQEKDQFTITPSKFYILLVAEAESRRSMSRFPCTRNTTRLDPEHCINSVRKRRKGRSGAQVTTPKAEFVNILSAHAKKPGAQRNACETLHRPSLTQLFDAWCRP
ncbi:hypothetical protein B0H19DRAFT_1228211 [Mycena capillaripes]|nr:hypothetical protein B0H19DRAFT_1228211 [Mycena capillaripes]